MVRDLVRRGHWGVPEKRRAASIRYTTCSDLNFLRASVQSIFLILRRLDDIDNLIVHLRSQELSANSFEC